MIDLIALWIGRVLLIGGGVALACVAITVIVGLPVEWSYQRLKNTIGATRAVDAVWRELKKKPAAADAKKGGANQ